MTLYLFNKLTLDQKLSIIEIHGADIDSREEEDYRVSLYQIDAFYVELYFSVKSNQLYKLESFNSTYKLMPYLQKIDLQLLLQDI